MMGIYTFYGSMIGLAVLAVAMIASLCGLFGKKDIK